MINDQIVGNQDNATVIQENSKVKRRVEWIDIARWIGITLIIISHTIMYENWYYFQNVLFMVHVPIFFFLSGYLYHNKTWRKRLSGILSTLILPYLVVGFIAIVMAWFVGHIGGFGIFKTPYDTHNAIKAVFLGFGSSQVLFNTNHIEPAIGAVWFLLGLAWGDFFFAIYLKLALKVKSIWGSVSFWIVLWGLAAGIAIFGFKLRPHGLLPLSLNAGLVAPLFMIFGYTLKQNGRWFDFTLKWPVSLGLLGIWLYASRFGTLALSQGAATNIYICTLGAYAGCIAVIKISQLIETYLPRLSHVAAYLGQMSMIILCFHLLEMNLSTISARLFAVFTSSNGHLIYDVLMVTGRLIFCYALAYLIPKIPFVRSFFLVRQYPFKEWFKGNRWQRK